MDGEDLRDLFSAFGPVSVRRMFGGAGLYADGVMFALEAGGVVYLKVDAAFAEALEKRGSAPFSYDTAKGRHTIASYWQVPEAAMDDPDDLAALARRALAIARAAAAERPKKARKTSRAGGAEVKAGSAGSSATHPKAGGTGRAKSQEGGSQGGGLDEANPGTGKAPGATKAVRPRRSSKAG